jgi:hypothetical protein
MFAARDLAKGQGTLTLNDITTYNSCFSWHECFLELLMRNPATTLKALVVFIWLTENT